MDDPYTAARKVASGTWLYDGAVSFAVSIPAFPFDYWSEVGPADYADDPIEPTPLGPDGVLYYVSFGPQRVDGGGFASVDEAKAEAQRRAPCIISWTA